MILKLKLKTPKGEATRTAENLKNKLIGKKVRSIKTETNKEDNIVIWTIDAEAKHYLKIIHKISAYDRMMNMMLGNKATKKYIKRYIGEEGLKEIEDMLKNQTSIEIIKN